jgi:hypothetical protein
VSDRLQVVDPMVSRAKFEREIAAFRSVEHVYRRQGCILIDATFPEVFIAIAVPQLKPTPIVAAVVIDYTDYDLEPLSVTFVDPFTREPLTAQNLSFGMWRRPPGISTENMAATMQFGQAPLAFIQSNSPDGRPFLCLPGVREYHDNPAHTGDPWLLHRGSGEGSLSFILDAIVAYGINPIACYQVNIAAQMNVVMMGIAPEKIPA